MSMRRALLFVLAAVLLLLLVVPLGGYLWLRTSLPQTQGTVRLEGLDAPVEVVRDEWGIPHIFAVTDHDAFMALGYVHAQDRLWQMEMNRRIGAGRLSELLGEATLDIDKFQRTLGYYRAATADYEVLGERSRMALDAYAAGVNGWLAEGHTLPPEFLLLGVEPEPWTPYDSLVWEKMMSWDLGGDYELELLRRQVAGALGPERAAQLLPPYPQEGVEILPGGVDLPGNNVGDDLGADSAADPAANPAAASTEAWLQTASDLLALDRRLQLEFGLGGREIGSNNWVLAGSRTESGMPLLADDPHLGNSIPSLWYLAELQGDKIHAIGATFPGLPAVVIGHNERLAWGVTNVGPDTQDLYIERINPADPNQYAVGDAWEEMVVVEEIIEIAGGERPLRWAARSTRHGPLISDVTGTGVPVALRWVALDEGDTTMDAFMGFNYAANWQEFVDSLRLYVSPSQNFVYADVDGNIGYYAPGRIPIRAAGHDGMLPVAGWEDNAEWAGYIPFDELPHAFNPESGFVASANNRIVGEDYPYLLSNDWAPPYRAERIVRMIEELSDSSENSGSATISVEDMAAMQGDRFSAQVADLLPFLLSVQPQDERQERALNYLQEWDGELAPGSVAASLYEAWMLHLERFLFADDLRGDLYDELSLRANPLFLTNVLNDAGLAAAWCDDVLAAGVQSCEEQAELALESALDDLAARAGDNMTDWRWERLHRTQYPHQPFSEVAYLKPLFHRSIGNGGDRYTVNVAAVDLDTPYDQTRGPGYRHIVDLGDLQNSRYIQTTGQSGNVLSSHYDDLIRLHRDVEYAPMRFGREQAAGDLLLLEP
jgi:penicillin amidase